MSSPTLVPNYSLTYSDNMLYINFIQTKTELTINNITGIRINIYDGIYIFSEYILELINTNNIITSNISTQGRTIPRNYSFVISYVNSSGVDGPTKIKQITSNTTSSYVPADEIITTQAQIIKTSSPVTTTQLQITPPFLSNNITTAATTQAPFITTAATTQAPFITTAATTQAPITPPYLVNNITTAAPAITQAPFITTASPITTQAQITPPYLVSNRITTTSVTTTTANTTTCY